MIAAVEDVTDRVLGVVDLIVALTGRRTGGYRLGLRSIITNSPEENGIVNTVE